MFLYFPDKEAISSDLRLLMRSRHIYILFNAMTHLFIGMLGTIAFKGWKRWAQRIGSTLLFTASTLAVAGFFWDTFELRAISPISEFGVITTFAGGLLHLLGGARKEGAEWKMENGQ